MTRVNNLNYTVAGENFQRGTATTDAFQTGDVQLLALAVENHQHQNTRGLPVMRVNSGTFASRPATGNAGHVYISTDQDRLSFDDGASWQEALINGQTRIVAIGTAPVPGNMFIARSTTSDATTFSLVGQNSAGTAVFSVRGDGLILSNGAGLQAQSGGVSIGNGQTPVATAGLTIGANAATDATNRWGIFINAPTGATGDNLGIVVRGGVVLGNPTIATNGTTGFVYLPSMPGAPTGVPADGNSQPANMTPIVTDTTNGRLWMRYGGVWHFVAFT